MPDYVGYGATSDREHPYTIHHELAGVSVDMLRATKQLVETLAVTFSNRVFLTGWSEGGGAGLATHKYLQEKYPDEFDIVGSSLLAGPYDYLSFVQDIMVNRYKENENLSIYSWSMYALNNYDSSLNTSANSIWKYPVTNEIDALDIPSIKAAEIFQTEFKGSRRVSGPCFGSTADKGPARVLTPIQAGRSRLFSLRFRQERLRQSRD